MIYKGRIITDPAIMLGKPIIKGTRITVEPEKAIGRYDRRRIIRGLENCQIRTKRGAS